jgi:desulfoferrodoxin (superoxide reductase-like protein)
MMMVSCSAVLVLSLLSLSSTYGSEALAAHFESQNPEGYLFTTDYFPSRVASKPPSHVPVLTVSGTTATVSVGASALVSVWVRDQTNSVIFYQAFTADNGTYPGWSVVGSTKSVSFTIPAASTSLTPYERCDLHGTWIGATVYPTWEESAATHFATNTLPDFYNSTYYPIGYESKPPTHVPVLTVSGNTATVTQGASVGTAAWVRDQSGNIIFFHTFATPGPGSVSFDIPVGSTELRPYEFCASHGVWEGVSTSLLAERQTTVASLVAPGLYNSTYYPASLASKPPTHVPVLTLSGTTATVTVSASALTAVWVMDQLDRPIFFEEFSVQSHAAALY